MEISSVENSTAIKQYIDMCRKAEEIQAVWVPKDGDVFCVESGCWADDEGDPSSEVGEIVVCGHGDYPRLDYPDGQTRENGSKFSYDKGAYLWLPRVGDLITIARAGAPGRDTCDLVRGFSHYVNDPRRFIEYDSFNILWLIFIMEDLFDKRWNGTDWTVVS